MHTTSQPDFERLYQQAYYRHSGFDAQAEARLAKAASARPAGRGFQSHNTLPGLAFAGVTLVLFVVPALAAALVV